MATILLAEQTILKTHRLEERLTGLGHQMVSVKTEMLVTMVKQHPFDAIVMSILFPDVQTDERICQLRLFSDVPILGVITEETSEAAERYMGKYLDGVFEVGTEEEELDEFVQTQLRRAYRRTHNMRLYQYKNLKISNCGLKRAEVNHHPLDLTVKEFMILSLLMRHRDRIYTKASLYESVWRQPFTGDDNAIKIHISNLRNKLKKADPEEKYIETVWGLGYRLCKD